MIGVNAFYELAWEKNTPYENKIKAEEAVAELKELIQVINKPLIFTELGFTSRKDTLFHPWQWPEQTSEVNYDENEQVRGYHAMLSAFASKPWFAGLFIWRYYAYLADVSQEPIWAFSPHGKLAETYLERAFSSPWAADPSPWPWKQAPNF
ncbi:MAG: hypothetical protein IPJ88_09275 [Myxococcales bacterium]|nr:MAG: hypothetical protein IPJ88_09275 [Myxococcales bacterium]